PSPANNRYCSPFHVRHLKRYKIGTSYPDIVADVKTLMETAPLRGRCTPAIDTTGCGEPVFKLFAKAKLDCYLYGVMIHAGDSVTCDKRIWRVPKRDLVATVQVLLQSQRLTIAKAHPEAGTLLQELMQFKTKIEPATAADSFSSWRESPHDDLVLATALAYWIAEHQRRVQIA